VPSGVPWFLLPIMLPIEILGLFTKPFALAMRLFANMIAGHTVIYALLGLIIVLGTYFVAPVSVAFALAIYFLELFVAFLQAYIFTMLTSLFVGMAAHPSH
jgi:F-type H+-transporting ATPase subunit a